MNHLRRFWPVYLAALTLFVMLFLSVRSWKTYDIFVVNRGTDGFPSITIFTVDSCIRGKVSDQLHTFEFDDQGVPTGNGWHTLPNATEDDGDRFYGALHFLSMWNDPTTSNWDIFLGIPIWLAFTPGYFPMILFLHKRRCENRE